MTYRQSYPLPTASATRGLGFNLHFDDGGKPGEFQMMKNAGANWVRTDLLWNGCEISRGVYNFTNWDKHFSGLKALKMRSVNILCYNNPIYMSEEQKKMQLNPWDVFFGLYGDEQIQAFLDFVAATVERYKGQGHIWEIWNEPNVDYFFKPKADPVQFMHIVERTAKLIRSIAPEEYIAVDISSTYGKSGVFGESLMQLGLLKFIDVLFIHPYNLTWWEERTFNPESSAAQYTKIKKMVAKYIEPGKYIRIFQGECGMTENSCNYYEPTPVVIPTVDAEAISNNILGIDAVNFKSSNWGGYWSKPALTTGIKDPLGLYNAVQMAPSDKLTDPGKNCSGLVLYGNQVTGSEENPEWYVLSYYARTTKGCLDVFMGLSDFGNYLAQHVIDDTWRRYWITFKVTGNLNNRAFQVYEAQPNNVAWQIAYPQVERIVNFEEDTQARRQRLQADFIVRQCKTAFQNGIGMFICYNWGDDGANTNQSWCNFGVVEEDRKTIKPAYTAIQKAYQYWKANGTPK